MLEFSVLPMPVCSSIRPANLFNLSNGLKAKGPPWWWAFPRGEILLQDQIG
jgi:hypothetical protein